MSANLNEARDKLSAENTLLNEKRTAAATSGERRRAAQNALKRVENEQTEIESRLARQNLEITETDNTAQELEKSIAQIEEKSNRIEEEKTGERDELEKATTHLKNARETADKTATELAELNKSLPKPVMKERQSKSDRRKLSLN